MRFLLSLVVFIPSIAFAQTPEEKAASLKYLTGLQQASGSFKSDAKGGPSLRATSASVRAIKYLGGELANPAQVKAYVLSCYDPPTGGFAEAGEKPTVLVTCIGIMAAVELGIPESKFPMAIDFLETEAKSFEDVRIGAAAIESLKAKPKWLDKWNVVANKQLNNDGTAGKGDNRARDTASVAAMKLRLGFPVVNKDKIFQMIRTNQGDDGGWKKDGAKTSDQETTYRVMRAMMLAKERPKNTFKLGEFLKSCRNADGGCGVAPGEPSSASGTYYYAIVSKWLEAKK
jgi:prenyltransferase beta subunit